VDGVPLPDGETGEAAGGGLLKPFKADLVAGATRMMPYYGRPIGTAYEEVGFGFNHGIITGLLCCASSSASTASSDTDWALITDRPIMGEPHEARAWGVERLSASERVLKALQAGVDQFGGEHRPELVVELIRSGQLAESRIDVSVRRLLAEKFRLGLFDDRRHVNPDAVEETVGRAEFHARRAAVQRRSLTLLKRGTRPLTGRPRLYVEGVDAAVAAAYARSWPPKAESPPSPADSPPKAHHTASASTASAPA
jgi:beta-glucosidase